LDARVRQTVSMRCSGNNLSSEDLKDLPMGDSEF